MEIYKEIQEYKRYIQSIVRDGLFLPSIDFYILLPFIGTVGAVCVIIPFIYSEGLYKYFFIKILCAIPGFLCLSTFILYFLIPIICDIVHAAVLHRRVGSSD